MVRSLFLAVAFSTVLRAGPDSFAYVLQADGLSKDPATAVAALTACGRDWIVLDAVFDSETPWAPADLQTIRTGKPGRKILAYISIGEAEDYRPYWKKEWGTRDKLSRSAPAWLGSENPDWKGNYRVRYWNAEWQSLILKSIDEATAAGFDGVYLDIVDGFETYEQQGEEFIDNRINPETRQSYRRDMVDWVKRVAGQARAKKPEALVVPQNGSQLLEHPDFIEAISATGIEDLFTEGNQVQPDSHREGILASLKKLQKAGKPVLVIEYAAKHRKAAVTQEACHRNGFIWLVTDRELKTMGLSGR